MPLATRGRRQKPPKRSTEPKTGRPAKGTTRRSMRLETTSGITPSSGLIGSSSSGVSSSLRPVAAEAEPVSSRRRSSAARPRRTEASRESSTAAAGSPDAAAGRAGGFLLGGSGARPKPCPAVSDLRAAHTTSGARSCGRRLIGASRYGAAPAALSSTNTLLNREVAIILFNSVFAPGWGMHSRWPRLGVEDTLANAR